MCTTCVCSAVKMRHGGGKRSITPSHERDPGLIATSAIACERKEFLQEAFQL